MARIVSKILKRVHRARRHHGLVEGQDVTPGRATLTPEDLDNIVRLQPSICRWQSLSCSACGRSLHPGHTMYILETDIKTYFVLCWECGRAIGDHLGYWHLADLPDCQPYGG